MLRKSLGILSVSALVVLSAQASYARTAYKGEPVYKEQPPCPIERMLAKGFYVGVGAGYDSYRARSTNTTDILAGAVGYDFSTTNHLDATGWVGDVFVGYDMPFDIWNIGLEAFYSRSGADGTENYNLLTGNGGVTTAATGQNKAQITNGYGISVLPGYFLSNGTLAFLRLGWTRSQFQLQNNSTVTGTAPILTGTVNTSLSQQQYRNGFTLGLGLETLIVDNWSVRGEFDHTWYNSGGFNGANISSVNLSNNQGNVSVIYHFI